MRGETRQTREHESSEYEERECRLTVSTVGSISAGICVLPIACTCIGVC